MTTALTSFSYFQTGQSRVSETVVCSDCTGGPWRYDKKLKSHTYTLHNVSWTTALWVPEEVLYLLIIGFVAAFILSFSVGANDVANSFGTTVGAKALTLRQACILASIFETSGAVLLGAKVGEMIRKGIIDVQFYQTEDGARLLMMGEVAAMLGSGIWQLIATFLKVPVSGTHSIVGACIGFSLVACGSSGVNWHNLGYIVASWFISPVLSGIMSVLLYYFIQRYILKADKPLVNGLKVLPFFYAFTISINIFSILRSGAPQLGLGHFPMWATLLAAVAIMILTALITQCFVVPIYKDKKDDKLELEETGDSKNDPDPEKASLQSSCGSVCKVESVNLTNSKEKEAMSVQKEKEAFGRENEKHKFVRFEKLQDQDSSSNESLSSDLNEEIEFHVKLMTSDTSIDQCGRKETSKTKKRKALPSTANDKNDAKPESVTLSLRDEEDKEDDPFVIKRLFTSLQVMTACFGSFAHGGNDVSNAIGPLIAVWIIFWSGNVAQKAFTPWYLLVYGGVGITIGLWAFGKRVMETIGKDLTKITPSRGFSIELMTAFTVLLASNLGIPISTTHCKVGAVVSIGWFRSRAAVDWSMVRNIAFAWFVTLPVAGLLSAGSMFILMQF